MFITYIIQTLWFQPRRTRIVALNLAPNDNDTIPFKITVDAGKIIRALRISSR